MKRTIVVKVRMCDEKSREKALKIAVSQSGVESVALKGQEKNEIEVIGDGVDAAELTMLLRKKVGLAELVLVTPLGEGGGDQENQDVDHLPQPITCPAPPSYSYVYQQPNFYKLEANDVSCIIM